MSTNATRPNQLILAAFNAAVLVAKATADIELQKTELKRLYFGSVRRSKVEGVRDQLSVQEMIMHLNNNLSTMPISNGRMSHRFELPSNYRAFTPIATVEQMFKKGDLFAANIKIVQLRGKNGGSEFRLHAPETRPLQTNVITFIMQDGKLIEWFAGEMETRSNASEVSALLDIGKQWVTLGVNLAEEAKAEHFRRKQNNQLKPQAMPARPAEHKAQPIGRPLITPTPAVKLHHSMPVGVGILASALDNAFAIKAATEVTGDIEEAAAQVGLIARTEDNTPAEHGMTEATAIQEAVNAS